MSPHGLNGATVSKSPRRQADTVRGKGKGNRCLEQHTMCMAAVESVACGTVLQFVGLYGNVKTPNYQSRNKRLSSLPKAGRSLVHVSAYISVPEVYPAAVTIGRVQRPACREVLAAFGRPGSVVTLPFSFNPKSQTTEVSHV